MWRQLRFDALSDSPDAFRSTLEEEQDQSDEWWIDVVDTTVEHLRGGLWIAQIDSVSVGMLFARIDTDHTVVEVGAMWVRPSVRVKASAQNYWELLSTGQDPVVSSMPSCG